MSIFNNFFTGKELPQTDGFVSLHQVNQSLGDYGLEDHTSPLVSAVINKIISRTMSVKLSVGSKARDDMLFKMPNPKQTMPMFIKELLQNYLVHGNAFIHKMGNNLYVLPSVAAEYSNADNTYHLNVDMYGKRMRYPAHQICHLTFWSNTGSTPYIAPSPIKTLLYALQTHKENIKLVHDYAMSAYKVAGTMKPKEEVANPEQTKKDMKEIGRNISGAKNNYGYLSLPPEFEFQFSKQIPSPIFEGLELAIKEVCNFYGVPYSLLVRTPEDVKELTLLNAHLLESSVYPFLNELTGKLSAFLDDVVVYDKMSLIQPSLGSMAKAMVSLSQVGVLTVGETRELMGLPKLGDERDNQLTQAAGAPERDNKNSEDKKREKDNESM